MCCSKQTQRRKYCIAIQLFWNDTRRLVLKKTVFLRGRVRWIWVWSTRLTWYVCRLWDVVFSWRFERLPFVGADGADCFEMRFMYWKHLIESMVDVHNMTQSNHSPWFRKIHVLESFTQMLFATSVATCRDRGVGGGGAGARGPPPQYFKNYRELVRKVSCAPPPPPPYWVANGAPQSQSCSAVPDIQWVYA